MKLGKLLESINKLVVKDNITDELKEIDVQYISNNSTKIEAGTVFICRVGNNFDSHTIVEKLYNEGNVIAFVTEKEVNSDIPYVQVYDSKLAEAYLADAFFEHPYNRLITFGITGTNGKTTCAHLFHHIMQQIGLTGSLSGTVMNDIMGDKFYIHNTTPDAIIIMENMSKTYKNGGSYYSMEVSSHSLDQARVETVRFDIAGLTNITRDHLNYHPSFEHYANAKIHLFDLLKKDGVAVINEDYLKLLNGKNLPKVVSIGVSEKADYRISNISTSWNGTIFNLRTPYGEKKVYTQMIGEYNAFNIALVLAGLVEIGYDIDEVISHVSTFRGVDGRFEPIPEARKLGIEVIIDFAHSPDALEKVITTARKLTKGRLIVVYGAGGQADKGKRPMMSEVVTKLSDIAILTTDDPRGEDPEEIIREVEKGIMPDSLSLTVLNRKEAIDTAITLATRGDVVLITGRGHEPYQIITDTLKIPFKDRDITLDIILSKINKNHNSRD
ncbi:MAG TPA: UDP-N-acetylmuramoyl-L-alanyl-D-glutamate--2,6-diaminopimelate ligase [Fervidobacterium sp.]|nr:UDP-N-acetylmuramoyl-L-alanyl-D-glutamate--2,6-diaminopimelate ligase [Fervidobacterium sp.]HOM74154.1 UDP-N-acetylmuramoyl-L-alanyl-D-glutamate--2,6-diaminopimelate ligase [Fervidobacterium sp.]HPP17806.1 UDP-N-acetylmuramoyl-L-alanyl-D-glutamate--2,6-diaminopimelate ligase [Fervidobacterium sp.]HPZ16979.1 UDP-N-acetylmuramoyl-L-alanyl-D-glutamate--2,6-diaminopimelate ligase [Fervidobacterium sp.]HQE48131.1 UDP-N-acetylmuramoyl-L-alanyl-D-glutamate--2,6-diaminopimelate ligase [Fervidobacter